MNQTEIEYDGDPSLQLRPGESILTPERARMPDIVIEVPCPDCDGKGLVAERRCVTCDGRRRVVDRNRDPADDQLPPVQFAQVQVRNVMNYMREKGFLTAQHVHCGQIFELWRICANSALGYRNNPIYAGEVIREAKRAVEAEGLEPGDYEKLMAELTVPEAKTIIFAIESMATTHNRWLAERYHAHYRKAFDKLADIMNRLRDEAEHREKESPCA